MNFLVTENGRASALERVPEGTMAQLIRDILGLCREGKRPILFFGLRDKEIVMVYAVLADDERAALHIGAGRAAPGSSYPSMTPEFPSMQLFERELHEEHAVTAEGHPWLKPARYGAGRACRASTMGGYPFFRMDGEQVHEVAVGPVHAGIIEPGHFRFQCHGEDVRHLEIQLGFQHRAVEDLIAAQGRGAAVTAESIAGDTVIGHAVTYARTIESLSGCEPGRADQAVRAAAQELERIAMHCADLSALCGDVAYQLGNAAFGAVRTRVINLMQSVCGNRFGRGLIRPGGCAFAVDRTRSLAFAQSVRSIVRDCERIGDCVFSSASVLSRFEHTGVVDQKTARAIGMVGLAARASGAALDVRCDHPYGMYRHTPVYPLSFGNGDVFGRAYLRQMEIGQSARLIEEQAGAMEGGGRLTPAGPLRPGAITVCLSEGWRGEIVHAAVTGPGGGIVRYKIKDPSFNNWFGLALAVRGNGISDFPLCNKSFNLSYAGHDI